MRHLLACLIMMTAMPGEATPQRARSIGIAPGRLPTGTLNAITDVPGVRVGQVTLRRDPDLRTGVTAILPHGGNLYADKVPAAIVVANGYGKLMGLSQVTELGEIETPVVLTNTLAVPEAAAGIIEWTLRQPGNGEVRSVNAVVGETNDGDLNDIRARAVRREDVLKAIAEAKDGPVAEGAVGAGTGTVAFGWKGGIGTSSRRLPDGSTVGVLVQSNYGGALQMGGTPIPAPPQLAGAMPQHPGLPPAGADGSIMIVIATDAPLSDRNLKRLAARAFAGLARTGSAFSNGSGDYAIAFSTAEAVRRTPARRAAVTSYPELGNEAMTLPFIAVADATEEAIANSLLMATTTTSTIAGRTRTVPALDADRVKALRQ